MTSSFSSGPGVTGLSGSVARFPPPYSVEQYNSQEGTCHEVRRLISLPDYPRRLLVINNHNGWDTAAGASR